MADHPRKSELIAELARARGDFMTHTRAVRREVDVVTRLKASFQRHGLIWLAGAGVLGLLLTRLPRRGKAAATSRQKPAPEATAVKAGLVVTGLKIAFDLLRPAITKWIAYQVTEYTTGRSHTRDRR